MSNIFNKPSSTLAEAFDTHVILPNPFAALSTGSSAAPRARAEKIIAKAEVKRTEGRLNNFSNAISIVIAIRKAR
jgi:hypothetical protein